MSRELGATCLAAAQRGAQVLRDLYARPRDIFLKGRIDLVTDADRAAEEAVLRVLAERAPGVKVLAEESGEHGAGETRFLVDPLDGTTNYAHGIPIFSCTVGAEVRGVVVAGATIDPIRGEAFTALRGGGAFLGEGRLHVSAARDLGEAVVCTGFPYDRERMPWMLAAFARFTEMARGTRRMGSAAIDLAYVAAGRLDGFWELGLKPWDVATGQLLVEEAGGLVTRFDGGLMALADGEIVAAGRGIHQAMLEVLKATASAIPPAAGALTSAR